MYRIKEICLEKEITLAELAKKIGIHPQSMSRIVSTNNTRPSTLERIAQGLGVKVEDLVVKDELYDSRVSVISPIQNDKMGVVKIISIYAPTKYGVMEIGYIVYRRSFYPKYRFNENQKSRNIMDEYPIQSSYPHDELDIAILNAIQGTYPESKLKNRLIVFNSDVDFINKLIDRPYKPIEVVLSPVLSYDEIMTYVGKVFSRYDFHFNLYYDCDFGPLRQVFVGDYELSKKDDFDTQLPTLTAL
jgi:DNA-binding Xre family transcriptional regulator